MSTAHIRVQPVHEDSVSAKDKSLSRRPHYLVLVAANGEPLATSEMLASRDGAREGIEAWLAAMQQVLNGVALGVDNVVRGLDD